MSVRARRRDSPRRACPYGGFGWPVKCRATCCRQRRSAACSASARFVIAPPKPASTPAVRGPEPPDRAAEGYAVLFARRYLTWESSRPQSGIQALQAFTGPGMEPDAGEVPPTSGEQRVEWAEVVQVRESVPGTRVYTVAAQTDTAGLLYLAVAVTRGAGDALRLAGYPAIVGGPSSAPGSPPAAEHELAEPALSTVVTRALRNYLAGSAGELAADLTSQARVSLPTTGLTLDSVQRMSWARSGPHGRGRRPGARRAGGRVPARLRTGCRPPAGALGGSCDPDRPRLIGREETRCAKTPVVGHCPR